MSRRRGRGAGSWSLLSRLAQLRDPGACRNVGGHPRAQKPRRPTHKLQRAETLAEIPGRRYFTIFSSNVTKSSCIGTR
eukprot:2532652-Pyramimonas_sp.AAC.1